MLDRAGRALYVSPAVTAHFGYDEVALSWYDGLSFVHPEDRPVLDAAWRRLLHAAGSSEAFEDRVRHADGSWRWCEHALSNLLDDPDVGGIVVNLRDVSERRRAQQELEHTALHDRLTGLANRALLFDRVDQALARDRRRDKRTGLVLLDVLDMSAVNEAVRPAVTPCCVSWPRDSWQRCGKSTVLPVSAVTTSSSWSMTWRRWRSCGPGGPSLPRRSVAPC